jgi:hypothetical protein
MKLSSSTFQELHLNIFSVCCRQHLQDDGESSSKVNFGINLERNTKIAIAFLLIYMMSMSEI